MEFTTLYFYRCRFLYWFLYVAKRSLIDEGVKTKLLCWYKDKSFYCFCSVKSVKKIVFCPWVDLRHGPRKKYPESDLYPAPKLEIPTNPWAQNYVYPKIPELKIQNIPELPPKSDYKNQLSPNKTWKLYIPPHKKPYIRSVPCSVCCYCLPLW